jgi:general secretion pathway protein M
MTMLPMIRARWSQISAREQRLLLVAMVWVLGALLWWVALAPALRTLRAAPAQHRALDAQLQQMQRLQAQAASIQAQPALSQEDARRLLEASVKPMGTSAQLMVTGDRVTVNFKGASPDALAPWLAQVRQNAHAVPAEARLARNAAGTWDGTMVLKLATR